MMIRRDFEQLRFKDDKEEAFVEVTFLDHFYFRLSHDELSSIGAFEVGKNHISFDANEKKMSRFDFLISKGFDNLVSRITGKKAIYVHSNSGIPLIGNGSFGIVDRGTNIIEIKPICGCNIDCIYCSVDENKRSADFIVEKDYLVSELKKVVAIKKKPVEVHIGCQGEPLLYAPLASLIKDCMAIPNVVRSSMDTNMTLLNEKKIDELIDAGLTQFNASLNAMDKERAVYIANKPYNLDHVLKMIRYVGTKPVKLIVAPVWMQGVNDEDMEKVIELCKEVGAVPGIQNYLNYSLGRKIGKSLSMKEFYDKLREFEGKHGMKLVIDKEDFHVEDDEELSKPFRKDEVVDASLVCIGRMGDEFIAVAKDRSISVYDDSGKLAKRLGQRIKVRIIRTKHNIYAAEAV